VLGGVSDKSVLLGYDLQRLVFKILTRDQKPGLPHIMGVVNPHAHFWKKNP
jgi:hypothetical protein